MPYNPPRDVCVSAPTGSGKSLAYVVPIIEVWVFLSRIIHVNLILHADTVDEDSH